MKSSAKEFSLANSARLKTNLIFIALTDAHRVFTAILDCNLHRMRDLIC